MTFFRIFSRRRVAACPYFFGLITAALVFASNASAQVITITPTTLPPGTLNLSYSQTVAATDNDSDDVTGPLDNDDTYTYAVTTGALPPGLTLNIYSGNIFGTPTAGGTYSFTITATNTASSPSSGSQAYSLVIGTNTLTLSPSTLPNGTVGTPYDQGVTASGGSGAYNYFVSSGALPAGLTLNPNTGTITGVPTTGGPASFTIEAVDPSTGNFATQAYNVNMGTNSLTLSPSTLPNGTHGVAYNQTVTASGGTGPYTYTVSAGTLPAGLTLNPSTGAITGTPTGSGASGFTIEATDSQGDTGSRAYSVNIGTNSLTINPSSLPAGTKGVAYNQTVTATGGSGPYTYSIASGALPAGLTLNAATGAITGTPTGSGVANFTVKAVDSNGDTGTRAYPLSIGTNSLTINPASLPAAVQGTPYNQTVTATGGTGPYTYAIIAGSLPPGLTFNPSTGLISGIPTGPGTFSVTIQATNSVGDTGSRAYAAFQVRPNPATDPDVVGLIGAQAATARQFASVQVTNVTSHMEDLHDAFDPCIMNIRFGASVVNQANQLPGSPLDADPTGPRASLPGTCAGRLATQFPLAFWTGGTLQFGTTTLGGSNNQFTTGGLTFGADGRISNALIVGVAIGYGSDRTDIGTDGTNLAGQNFDAMVYASYQPFTGWFLDAVAGYGSLSFNNQRFDSFDSSTVTGTRTGTEWFSSLTASTDFKTGAMKFSPYVRADLMSASLQSYAEQGTSSLALTYGGVSFSSTAGVLGLRGSYDIPTSWGVLQPTGRLEFRHEFDGGFNQAMYYTDLGAGQTYVLNEADAAVNTVTGAVGLRARAGNHLSAELEYRTTAGDNSTIIQTIRAALRLAF
jgi:uncharacterized protein YhjY with autotransporter beta-barrel domain